MVEGHTNWTTMFLQILFLICSVCNTHGVASTASPSCPADEYRAGQVCCLACPGGYRVHRDCTATSNSLCSKCPDGTFKEGLSGQKQCSACTKCDPGLGRKVKKWCTPTSDAECDIRDGFFCSESADKDTFSKATLSCQPHTIFRCDFWMQIQPGTDSTDSTCTPDVLLLLMIGSLLCLMTLLIVRSGRAGRAACSARYGSGGTASIPPAPSSETQPAETTPLMSSESPAPTGDQQEHTSRTTTPDVTMDGHDDDQSLDALAYRSGTGQQDIEMGPVQTLPKDRNRIL
ncbi:tumor necrosis factor receptor superfamily member 14 isoform X17 [Gadus morhua]|uniref:tumor necrosis factor receptor superfamily member 14 isoform X17 n=1 Tax=Gadus morhua TaxID=8049 RepID=UPI0011B60DBF|nr:tumor necrosis factor receptor superfamily member 14-like isoform X17 [Gadus morhua]XP_030197788.1 tumor necrosis factor receptor superfamily member 14-like isoform X17 [Gadus morhua]XP_030197871.1 tumor necrosis factor receptor superfamily member 14-like isoform X17 [Gadus morhua]XP_030197957.1 tumor necrosis factor receptor superfamily member 14-like isoform X17 [Gadus morhua]